MKKGICISILNRNSIDMRRKIKNKSKGEVREGDCLDVMLLMPDESIDSIVTDPPYGLSFMGKNWDHGIPGKAYWREVYRVAKPGSHLLAFGGTRTFHRLACAIEDAGWEIRDCLMWLYGCLSEDTEILIDGRWEPYHKATCNNHALCYDIEHDEYSWQKIEDTYIYEYEDTAYRIQSDNTDQLVSRNHRCVIERNGKYVFEYAEEVARQCEASIPILENLSDLLYDLSMQYEGTGNEKQILYQEMYSNYSQEESVEGPQRGVDRVCCMRQESMESECSSKADKGTDVFTTLQRDTQRGRVGEVCSQRSAKLDRRFYKKLSGENDGAKQSGVEGGCNVLWNEKELQSDQIYKMSKGVQGYGKKGRLYNGTSIDCCDGNRQKSKTNGSSSPCKSRSYRQQNRKSRTLFKPQLPQTIRSKGYTKTEVARISEVDYKGKVWCVKVPTGSFVARRNGKVFITGNSGMKKGLDISKAIDSFKGETREVIGKDKRGSKDNASVFDDKNCGYKIEFDITEPKSKEAIQWDGWHTGLTPAWEPIILARKPIPTTIAKNVLEYGTGGINIDGCRIETDDNLNGGAYSNDNGRDDAAYVMRGNRGEYKQPKGRWPKNVILDEESAAMVDEQSGIRPLGNIPAKTKGSPFGGKNDKIRTDSGSLGDQGGASRFFKIVEQDRFYYSGKSSRTERETGMGSLKEDQDKRGNVHPTVKPLDLMRYLVRLITPPNGTVLDPFAGSGTTIIAAMKEGFKGIGIEKESQYVKICNNRIKSMDAEILLDRIKV
jgi:DNA modification methylase